MTDDSMTQVATAAEQGSEEHLARVARMFEDGSIFGRAEAYVNACLQGAEEGERAQFPNLAGFGRALGVGLGELQRLGQRHPTAYDAILAVLEDGALNTDRIPGKSALSDRLFAHYAEGVSRLTQEGCSGELVGIRDVYGFDD